MEQIFSILELGGILSLVTLAALITFRLAGFPDLSVDGVFVLGAAVFAKCAVAGVSVPLCILAAVVAGAIAGITTASISDRLKIHPLLASVLVLIILYSLNLRVLGKANQPLFAIGLQTMDQPLQPLVTFLVIAGTMLVIAYFFFTTEFGSALRCTGTSPTFLRSVGKNVSLYQLILVMSAGSLVATSGCLLSMKYRFADVSIGTGVIIVGIASLIIGERICGRYPFRNQVLAVPVGIFAYQLAVGLALSAGISPIDVKLTTGVITIALLAIGAKTGDRLFAERI